MTATTLFRVEMIDGYGEEIPICIENLEYQDNIKTLTVRLNGELSGLSKNQIDILLYAIERLVDYGGNVDSMKEYLDVYDFLEKLRGRK